MGSSPSIECEIGPASDGVGMSYYTGPLDDYMTETQFWEAKRKNNLNPQGDDIVESDVKQLEDGALQVSVVTKSLGGLYFRLYDDLENHVQRMVQYFDADFVVVNSVYTLKALSNPFRLEMKREIAPRRAAGPAVSGPAKIMLNEVCKELDKQDDTPHFLDFQESTTDPGEYSCISLPFPDEITPEKFLDAFKEVVKKGRPGLPFRTGFELKLDEDESSENFTTVNKFDQGDFITKYEFAPDVIKMHNYTGEGYTNNTVIKLLKDPFRLETYSLIQPMVSTVIENKYMLAAIALKATEIVAAG